MEQRQVRVSVVLASVLWLVGSLVVLTGILLQWYGIPAVGLVCCLAAAVMNVRGFMHNFGGLLRDAFEGGREYERAHSRNRPEVRSLR